jgi:hypothetical protein
MNLGDGVLGSALRAEAIGTWLEVRLEDGFEHQLQGRLDHAVGHGGDGDFILPILAVVSGNLAFSMMFPLLRSCQQGLTFEAARRGSGVFSASWCGGRRG